MTATRILTPRLLLRPYGEADAEARRALLDANDAHLRPWIPWMRNEPMSLKATRALLREHAARFAACEIFRYVIELRDCGRMIGETGLYPRIGPDALEAGYLVDHRAGGLGYASEAAAAMVKVAFDVERVSRVELHCAPGNAASIRVAEKLGFELLEIRPDDSEDSEGRLQDSMIWVLPADLYPGSPAHALELEVWSEDGSRLL
jgi:RimJ/RimL family protein N-acetyltransferase